MTDLGEILANQDDAAGGERRVLLAGLRWAREAQPSLLVSLPAGKKAEARLGCLSCCAPSQKSALEHLLALSCKAIQVSRDDGLSNLRLN